jgi:hypothetical protein
MISTFRRGFVREPASDRDVAQSQKPGSGGGLDEVWRIRGENEGGFPSVMRSTMRLLNGEDVDATAPAIEVFSKHGGRAAGNGNGTANNGEWSATGTHVLSCSHEPTLGLNRQDRDSCDGLVRVRRLEHGMDRARAPSMEKAFPAMFGTGRIAIQDTYSRQRPPRRLLSESSVSQRIV